MLNTHIYINDNDVPRWPDSSFAGNAICLLHFDYSACTLITWKFLQIITIFSFMYKLYKKTLMQSINSPAGDRL